MITRRQLLQRSTAWTTAALLGDFFPGLALGEPVLDAPNHFFVLLRCFGGMDVTLGLDPQILPPGTDSEDMYLEYRPEDIIQASGLRLGPSAKPLVPHAADCLVVNGIMMRRDAGHDVGNLYMTSGRGDNRAAHFPVELALALGAGPFGIVTNGNVFVAGKAASLSTTTDIVGEMQGGGLIELIEQRLKLLAQQQGTPFEEAEKQVVAGKTAAVELVKGLKKFQETEGKIEDRHVLAATLTSGAASQGMLDLPISPGQLDTHSNHVGNHLRIQTTVWEEVVKVFALFKKIPFASGSLFDSTTFLVATEFSRTPFLNAAGGKDHNPLTNSVLIAGRGVHGGRTVGASRVISRKKTGTGMAEHIAWPYDFKEQKLATGPQGASFFYPENVIKTLAGLYGNPPAFTAIPASVPVIPGVLKG